MTACNYAHKKTLADENQFHFVCPIFGAETRIAACLTLRDMVWRGEQPESRRGCQICMRADKCPINNIIKDMIRADSDPYHSDVKKVGVLHPAHLASVERVVVLEKTLERAVESGVSAAEIQKIKKANDIARGLANRERPHKPEAMIDVAKKAAPATETSMPVQPDMASVVNEMMKDAQNEQ